MFILYLPLAVFSFSVKSSSFALASKARISLHYSHLCTLYFKKTQTRISGLPNNLTELTLEGIAVDIPLSTDINHVPSSSVVPIKGALQGPFPLLLNAQTCTL